MLEQKVHDFRFMTQSMILYLYLKGSKFDEILTFFKSSQFLSPKEAIGFLAVFGYFEASSFTWCIVSFCIWSETLKIFDIKMSSRKTC